jgi:membrane-bound ClpP family serine protease
MACVMVLCWVHLTAQSRVSRSAGRSLAIARRLLMIWVFTYVLFIVVLGLSIKFTLILTSIVFFISPLATLHAFEVHAVVLIAIVSTLILPIYALKQFVLGFPDRELLILAPPPEINTPSELTELKGAVGVVLSTLKPSGKVEIHGSEHSAITADGKLLEPGTRIRVTNVRNATLIVRAYDAYTT